MRVEFYNNATIIAKNPTFKEADECEPSWEKTLKKLERRRKTINKQIAYEDWWQNASEWEKLKVTIKDFFKNLFRK